MIQPGRRETAPESLSVGDVGDVAGVSLLLCGDGDVT